MMSMCPAHDSGTHLSGFSASFSFLHPLFLTLRALRALVLAPFDFFFFLSPGQNTCGVSSEAIRAEHHLPQLLLFLLSHHLAAFSCHRAGRGSRFDEFQWKTLICFVCLFNHSLAKAVGIFGWF